MKILGVSLLEGAPKKPKPIKGTQDRVRRAVKRREGAIAPPDILAEFYGGKLPRNFSRVYQLPLAQIESAMANLCRDGLLEEVGEHTYRRVLKEPTVSQEYTNGSANNGNNGHGDNLSTSITFPTKEEILQHAARRLGYLFLQTGKTEYGIEELLVKKLIESGVTQNYLAHILHDSQEKLREMAGVPKGELHIDFNGYVRNGAQNRYYRRRLESTFQSIEETLGLDEDHTEVAHELSLDITIGILSLYPDFLRRSYRDGRVEFRHNSRFGGAKGGDAAERARKYLLIVTRYQSQTAGYDAAPKIYVHNASNGGATIQLDETAKSLFREFVDGNHMLKGAAGI